MFPEAAQALGHDPTDPKLPDWVRNAWQYVAQDFFGITTLHPAAGPPSRLGKQMAMAQYLLNEFRQEPFPLDDEQRKSVDMALGALEGWILGVIRDQLSRNDPKSAQFFAAFARFKSGAAMPSQGQVGRATLPTYLALIVRWPEVERCRNRKEAFELLRQMGLLKEPEQDAFNQLCKPIKLKPGERGRPTRP